MRLILTGVIVVATGCFGLSSCTREAPPGPGDICLSNGLVYRSASITAIQGSSVHLKYQGLGGERTAIVPIKLVPGDVLARARANWDQPVPRAQLREIPSPAYGGNTSFHFALQGVNYNFTLPPGFCRVSGDNKKWADDTASLDPRNMTHFAIIPQTQDKPEADITTWGVLKTPRRSIGKRVPSRGEMIEEMKTLIKSPEYAKLLNDANKILGKTIQDVFGEEAKLGQKMEFVEADDSAIYQVGTVEFVIAGTNGIVACAGASTVVRGHVFFYYKYSVSHELSDLGALLKQVKAETRQFVRDNPD